LPMKSDGLSTVKIIYRTEVNLFLLTSLGLNQAFC
jgi:hypothetical protein